MRTSPILTIAHKEFSDLVSDRKILMILTILFFVTVIGSLAGVQTYHLLSTAYFQNLTITMNTAFPSVQPSPMVVFFAFSSILTVTCSLLGIATGYDQIIRERSQNSLKLLLSLPVYRDEVIKGKAIGGLTVLFLSIFCSFLITGMIILGSGIVPQGRDLILICLYFFAVFLLVVTYYAIGMLTTVCTLDSKKALAYAVILFVLFSSLIPLIVQGNGTDQAGTVTHLILGPPRDFMKEQIQVQNEVNEQVQNQGIDDQSENSRLMEEAFKRNEEVMYEKYKDYNARLMLFSMIMTAVSPDMKITRIANTFAYPVKPPEKITWDPYTTVRMNEMPLGEIIGTHVVNLLVLLILPFILLGLSYIIFMRTEVR